MIKIIIALGLMLRSLLCWLLLGMSGLALATTTTPTEGFTDNGDGTVTHKITRLIWKRCAEGQIWAGSACTGIYATYTYDQALKITSSFGRKTDWRLPNREELSIIVARENNNPAINTTIFPNTPATWFWSASASDPYGAWNISFFNGEHHYDLKHEHFAVRLVLDGQ